MCGSGRKGKIRKTLDVSSCTPYFCCPPSPRHWKRDRILSGQDLVTVTECVIWGAGDRARRSLLAFAFSTNILVPTSC